MSVGVKKKEKSQHSIILYPCLSTKVKCLTSIGVTAKTLRLFLMFSADSCSSEGSSVSWDSPPAYKWTSAVNCSQKKKKKQQHDYNSSSNPPLGQFTN